MDNNKVVVTYQDFDKMLELFDQMEPIDPDWWPSIEQINTYIIPNIKKNMQFMIWITESANEPDTPEKKESKKMLLKLINENYVVK